MAFIEKQDPIILNIKLTTEGRKQLSLGDLNFTYYALGDSEIDYDYINRSKKINEDFNINDCVILRPADVNPSILSTIRKGQSGSPFNRINKIQLNPYMIQNQTKENGFFSSDEDGNLKFKTGPNYIKQPDLMVKTNTVAGGNTLVLEETSNQISPTKPEIGDYLLIRWSTVENTIDFKLTNSETPLIYKIHEVDGYNITVDRELPNFSSEPQKENGVLVLYDTLSYSGDTNLVHNMPATDYLSPSVMSFLNNFECDPTTVYPYWNLSIIRTDDIAGIGANGKRFVDFKTSGMGGFVSYIQNREEFDTEELKVKLEERNLYKGTINFDGDKWINLVSSTTDSPLWELLDEKINGFTVARRSERWNGTSQRIHAIEGENYVFSAWVRKEIDSNVSFYTHNNVVLVETDGATQEVEDSDNTINWDITDRLSEEWQRIEIKFTITKSGPIRPCITPTNNGWVEVYGITLERGLFATQWTPPMPKYDSIGVIHYTNPSPSNVYAEGFYRDNVKIDLPLIRVADKSSIGIEIIPFGGEKSVKGLDMHYFDIGYVNDKNEEIIVGKMFHDLKIFIIEDQEMLNALSYKSNRTWTLPDYTINIT